MTAPTSLTSIDVPGGGALLIPAKEAAKLCGVSVAAFWRWNSAGYVPSPIKIGGSTRWRAEDLRAWVEAGCPRRTDQST